MKGILVYNHFYKGTSYINNINLYYEGIKRAGLDIEKVSNKELPVTFIDSKINIPQYDFAVFLDKDIYLAKALEKNGTRVFNSPEAIRICDNKLETYIELSGKGINMPYTVAQPFTFENIGYKNCDIITDIEFPVIAKELYGSLGEQVYMLNSRKDINKIKTNKQFIFQQYLPEGNTDIRVFVLDKKAICAMKRSNEESYLSNAEQGGKCTVFELTDKIKAQAEKAASALKLDFCGVDIIISNNTAYVIEVNSNTMINNLVKVTNIDVGYLIGKYIKDSI